MDKRGDRPKIVRVLMIEIRFVELGHSVECVYGALPNRICSPHRAWLEVCYFVHYLIDEHLECAVDLTELRSHPSEKPLAVDVPRPLLTVLVCREVVPFNLTRDNANPLR